MNINTDFLTNPFAYLWLLTVLFQECVSIWAYLRCFNVRKDKSPAALYISSILILLCIQVIFRFIFPGLSALIAVLNIVICTLLRSRFTHDGIIKSFIFGLCILLSDSIIEIIIHFVCSFSETYDVSKVIGAFDFDKVFLSVVFLLVSTPIKFFLSELWNRIVNKNSAKGINRMFAVFPIAQTVAFIALASNTIYEENNILSGYMLTLLSMIFFSISDIVFLFLISDLEKKLHIENELIMFEKMYAAEKKHYEAIEAKRYETAKIRHDIKNQMIAVKTLISQGQLTDADGIINEIEKNLNSTTEYEYCSIPIVNAVIEEKKTICDINDIIFSSDINLTDTDGIAGNHICSIFSNMLDNAIKENMKITDVSSRCIEIKAFQQNGYTVIGCKNPTSEQIESRTLYPDSSSGYGLKILRDISSHYNGSFDIEINNSLCSSVIMIQNKLPVSVCAALE